MRHEAELHYKVKHLIDLVQLLLFNTTVKHLHNKLVEVFLVRCEFDQFQVSEKDVLWINSRIRHHSDNVQQE